MWKKTELTFKEINQNPLDIELQLDKQELSLKREILETVESSQCTHRERHWEKYLTTFGQENEVKSWKKQEVSRVFSREKKKKNSPTKGDVSQDMRENSNGYVFPNMEKKWQEDEKVRKKKICEWSFIRDFLEEQNKIKKN